MQTDGMVKQQHWRNLNPAGVIGFLVFVLPGGFFEDGGGQQSQ